MPGVGKARIGLKNDKQDANGMWRHETMGPSVRFPRLRVAPSGGADGHVFQETLPD
jgi:hypothetical protein